MIVCSFITISVVSGRGRLTLDAMAVASVSTIILKGFYKHGRLDVALHKDVPIVNCFIQAQQHQIQAFQYGSLLQLIAQQHRQCIRQ
jgi:hypothetical protein